MAEIDLFKRVCC